MTDQPESALAGHPVARALLERAIEGAIAGYLAVSPGRRDLLAPLAGKVLALHLRPFGGSIWLCPTTTDVQVLSEFSGTADVTVSGDISGFWRWGLGGAARESLAEGELRVEGDDAAIEGFRALFAGLDRRDPATVGAAGPAGAVLGLLGLALRWGRNTAATLQTDLAEFWQEETRELPSRPEAEAFNEDVDRLGAAIDRLENRVRQLQDRLGPPL